MVHSRKAVLNVRGGGEEVRRGGDGIWLWRDVGGDRAGRQGRGGLGRALGSWRAEGRGRREAGH